LDKDEDQKSAYFADSTAKAPPQTQERVFLPAPAAGPATTPPVPPADSAPVTDQLVARSELLQSKLAYDANKQSRDGFKSDEPNALKSLQAAKPAEVATATPAPAPAADTRKLIRNAQLDLQVKSYQSTLDQVSALTRAAGGYVDTSSSQRGGNGKLQGTVVVKILPENLDAFLLKLRDLGEVQNQSVSTDDVTKEYFDTQARLVNSQKMELQLQELLKRENSKVSDLLAVERELGRVRGDIEQMQGQLKLYDFQVQYATVTMNIAEKDLNQAAAYLLKEQDDFSLYATDVEGAFKKARAAADQFNAQVLAANLEHLVNSDNNQVTASLVVMVAPDQIEPFLTQVRGFGRVANFTRQTQRVAKDGGDSSQPADETKTEKDKVRVQLSIRSDDDSRKQVALTVVTKDVNAALEQAKAAALANAGTEILGSSLNTSPQGASTAQLNVRVPGKEYTTLMDAFRALGRRASLSVQRNDNAGPGASGDDVPVIVTLALTDNDAPVQETSLVLSANDVDTQAQQIKKQAGDAGVEIKSSSFERQPDGSELAQMTLRLPLGHYAAFLATLQQAGKTESLSVQRDDRPDQTRPDDSAPAEIQLQVHNPPSIVPDNSGLWATLRDTFAQGFGALFGSVKVIGVIIAFLIPWVVAIVVLAWLGRRIYVWRKQR
jgi:glycine cleavage system regulatory protein